MSAVGRTYDTLVLLFRICGEKASNDFIKVVGLSGVTIRCCVCSLVRNFGMIPVRDKISVFMF